MFLVIFYKEEVKNCLSNNCKIYCLFDTANCKTNKFAACTIPLSQDNTCRAPPRIQHLDQLNPDGAAATFSASLPKTIE